ncbi:MAG: hypothetical protein P8Y20_12685 [Gammaproteobacteria bacterium]
MPNADYIEKEIENARKQLLDQQTTARLVGYKSHHAKISAEHTKLLLHRKAIQLPRNADGVRVRLELSSGRLSKDSHRVVCRLLK